MMHSPFLPLAGYSLLFFASSSVAAGAVSVNGCDTLSRPQESQCSPIVTTKVTAKMEAFALRNKKLRNGDKRENELELEPLLRLDARIMPDSPVYGRLEMEWKRQTERKSGERPEKQTRLDLNQAYIGLTSGVVSQTRWKFGRWLYRDERKWLIDENLDGALVKWRHGDWSADIFGGRVNFWQKDLMDRRSRNTASVNIMGLLTHYKITGGWKMGLYGLVQSNVSDDSFRLNNLGFRSHDSRHDRLHHWLEMGMAKGYEKGARIHGYALDVGGTYLFPINTLQPRLTLGYAIATQRYRQTGLQGNDSRFGGNTRFKIYGETLDPGLSNLRIITLGVGANIAEQSSLSLVYHDYSQVRLGKLATNQMALRPRHDRQSGRHLGYGVDLIYGWEPVDNIRLESKLGMFKPSSRFSSGSKPTSPGSSPAYSAGIEVEFSF